MANQRQPVKCESVIRTWEVVNWCIYQAKMADGTIKNMDYMDCTDNPGATSSMIGFMENIPSKSMFFTTKIRGFYHQDPPSIVFPCSFPPMEVTGTSFDMITQSHDLHVLDLHVHSTSFNIIQHHSTLFNIIQQNKLLVKI